MSFSTICWWDFKSLIVCSLEPSWLIFLLFLKGIWLGLGETLAPVNLPTGPELRWNFKATQRDKGSQYGAEWLSGEEGHWGLLFTLSHLSFFSTVQRSYTTFWQVTRFVWTANTHFIDLLGHTQMNWKIYTRAHSYTYECARGGSQVCARRHTFSYIYTGSRCLLIPLLYQCSYLGMTRVSCWYKWVVLCLVDRDYRG